MMRFAIILGTLLVAGCSYQDQQPAAGEEQAAQEGSVAPDSQEAGAVAQLNEACPENWCAGDYEYTFETISCAGVSCSLSFKAERDGETFEGSIRFEFDDPLLDEFGDLDASYFERVSDQLDIWEANR